MIYQDMLCTCSKCGKIPNQEITKFYFEKNYGENLKLEDNIRFVCDNCLKEEEKRWTIKEVEWLTEPNEMNAVEAIVTFKDGRQITVEYSNNLLPKTSVDYEAPQTFANKLAEHRQQFNAEQANKLVFINFVEEFGSNRFSFKLKSGKEINEVPFEIGRGNQIVIHPDLSKMVDKVVLDRIKAAWNEYSNINN